MLTQKKYGGVLLLLVASFQISFAGLLPNGHFENAPNPTQMSGRKVNGKHSIPDWETKGFVEYIKSGYKQGDMLLVVPRGEYAVRLGNEASIKQTVRLEKGKFYAVTFSFARTCAQEEKLNVSVSPTSEPNDWGILPLQTMYSSVGFDSYAWGFLAEEEHVQITLHNPGRDDDPACGPLIDTVAVNILRPPHLITADNLMKNGNFEEGPYVFHKSTWGVLIPPNVEDDHSPLPGWMIESLKAVKYIDSPHFSVPVGSRAVELVSGKESALAQIIRTVPGQTYSLTFALGDAGNACVGPMEVEAFAARDSVRAVYDSKGKGGFVRAQLPSLPPLPTSSLVALQTIRLLFSAPTLLPSPNPAPSDSTIYGANMSHSFLPSRQLGKQA